MPSGLTVRRAGSMACDRPRGGRGQTLLPLLHEVGGRLLDVAGGQNIQGCWPGELVQLGP